LGFIIDYICGNYYIFINIYIHTLYLTIKDIFQVFQTVYISFGYTYWNINFGKLVLQIWLVQLGLYYKLRFICTGTQPHLFHNTLRYICITVNPLISHVQFNIILVKFQKLNLLKDRFFFLLRNILLVLNLNHIL